MRVHVLPCLAAGMALSMLLVAVSAEGAKKAAPACAPGRADVLCVIRPLVRIGPKPKSSRKVKSGTARRVGPASTIGLTKGGVANLFLGRAAQCQDVSRSRGGTRVLTRRPESFLFRQLRGDALCTMADLRIVLVKAKTSLRHARYLDRGKGPVFFASLEARAGRRSIATEYRIRFYPRTSFTLATHRGGILLRLSTEAVYSVPAGREVSVALRRDKTIASVTVGTAQFTPSEEAVFATQFQIPDLDVTVNNVLENCPGGPGTCTTTALYTVRNIGRTAAPGFEILVEADPGLGVEVADSTGALKPGEARRLRTSVGPDGNCFDPDCSVRVTLDPKDSLLESNEQNNVGTRTILG